MNNFRFLDEPNKSIFDEAKPTHSFILNGKEIFVQALTVRDAFRKALDKIPEEELGELKVFKDNFNNITIRNADEAKDE